MNSLPQSTRPDSLFHRIEGSQIDFHSEKIAEPTFQPSHVKEGEALGAVEICHQVNVRLGRGLAARHRAEQTQVHDASRPQFRLM